MDAVLVWKLDRFGRSVLDLVNRIDTLTRYHVRLIATSQGIDTNADNPAGRFLLHILAAVAELERVLIRERVRAGIARRKSKGLPLGRQRKVFDRGRAAELRAEGWSWRRIAHAVGVSTPTVIRAVREFSQ